MEEKEYCLKISPEILELLGPSLYTNVYYVLAELIANAYDADAKNVYIMQFPDAIIVEDDGLGMSYGEGIKKYLQVAKSTRNSHLDDMTPSGRLKMGRKGIGKLAALAVSETVKVMTKAEDETSGFILSRHVPDDHRLEPIPDDRISFENEIEHGTSIVMINPEYTLHKTQDAQKRNITRMFPVIGENFIIHLIDEKGNSTIVESFENEIIPQLCTLITIGEEFEYLHDLFDTNYPEIRDKIARQLDPSSVSKVVSMLDKNGNPVQRTIEIRGWIGTYGTTTNRKKEANDFPDNFLSLFANGKLGKYNIIPELSQNRLNESYVVGQLHIDVFEDTDLPDMALSNRQGYKVDDPRYQAALEIIRPELFAQILNMREIFTDEKRKKRDAVRNKEKKEAERKLREGAARFSERIIDQLASDKLETGDERKNAAKKIVNEGLPLLGLKQQVDANKKKLLISHGAEDIQVAQLLYDLLLMNGVNAEDIIYTSSELEESRIPDGAPIYDYLREFFVESQSSQMINVLFVVSDNSSKRWAPVCEVGAAWVTKADHKVFAVGGFRPGKPLDNESTWHDSSTVGNEIHMDRINADELKVKIRNICRSLGVEPCDDATIAKQIAAKVIIDN